jgi:hypothetical protein
MGTVACGRIPRARCPWPLFTARWPLFSQPGGHFFRNRASFQTTRPLCLEKLAMSWRTRWLSEGVARADRAGLANQRRQDAGAQFAWSERRQDAGASVRRDGTGHPERAGRETIRSRRDRATRWPPRDRPIKNHTPHGVLAVRGGRRKFRRYLLSRFGHYHRLWKLNCRVRDGNGCDLPDMVTGKFPYVPLSRHEYGVVVIGMDSLFASPRYEWSSNRPLVPVS